jgi:hypothetical protein
LLHGRNVDRFAAGFDQLWPIRGRMITLMADVSRTFPERVRHHGGHCTAWAVATEKMSVTKSSLL